MQRLISGPGTIHAHSTCNRHAIPYHPRREETNAETHCSIDKISEEKAEKENALVYIQDVFRKRNGCNNQQKTTKEEIALPDCIPPTYSQQQQINGQPDDPVF